MLDLVTILQFVNSFRMAKFPLLLFSQSVFISFCRQCLFFVNNSVYFFFYFSFRQAIWNFSYDIYKVKRMHVTIRIFRTFQIHQTTKQTTKCGQYQTIFFVIYIYHVLSTLCIFYIHWHMDVCCWRYIIKLHLFILACWWIYFSSVIDEYRFYISTMF